MNYMATMKKHTNEASAAKKPARPSVKSKATGKPGSGPKAAGKPGSGPKAVGKLGAKNAGKPAKKSGSGKTVLQRAKGASKKLAKRYEEKRYATVPSDEELRIRTAGGLFCPVDAKCGGCQQCAVPYAQQLAEKDERMHALFAGMAPREAFRPILGMRDPRYYRDKVMSPFVAGKRLPGTRSQRDVRNAKNFRGGKGEGGLRLGRGERRRLDREVLTGMYAQGTHKIIPTDECLIENPLAHTVISAIAQLMGKYGVPPYNEDTGNGFMRHAVIRIGHESGEVLVTLVTNGHEFPAAKAFCKELVRMCPQITSVVQNINERQTNVVLGKEERTLYGPGFILDTLCGLSFRISSQSFYQVNSKQTEVLYRAAIDLAELTGEETVIDAYCGTGTIGLVAAAGIDGAAGAAQVIGVEAVPDAVRDARLNARHNGVENAQFVAADATDLMRALAGHAASDHAKRAVAELSEINADQLVLMMDPPRAGSTPEFMDAAIALNPARIVYISCNPNTQVRDIEPLLDAGYAITRVQPVDMFPHTDHVECIVSLKR